MKKNTYTLAYEACEGFFLETGLMPTIESIKSIIEVNSPTTISNAIKDWKQALARSTQKKPQPIPGIPNALINAVTALWEQALQEAQQTFKEQTLEIQETKNLLTQKEKALGDEEKRINHLVQLTEQKYQEEIAYLKKEIQRISNESASLIEQAERFRTIASEHDKNNAILKEQLRQEQEKYIRIENQYEKEHDWCLKRIEEEKNNYRLQVQNEMNRLHSEASRNRQSNELMQAKLELMLEQTNEERNKNLSLEKNLAHEKLKMASLTLSEVNLQKILADKETQIKSLLNKSSKKTDTIANRSPKKTTKK